MKIQPLHDNFTLPVRSTALAGGYDLFMPTAGIIYPNQPNGCMVSLGFAAEVPIGCVALLLPRSGTGSKWGLMMNNTCGVIDSDYRGEWKASLRILNAEQFSWEVGDRLLQMLIVPVVMPTLEVADTLSQTDRGEGGFGSTGIGRA